MEKDLDLYAAFYQVKKEMAKLAKDDEIAYGDAYKKLEDSFNRCRPVVAEEIYALCNRVNSVLEMLPDTMREKCKINTKNKPSIFLTGEFSGGKTTLIHQLAGHKSGSESGGPETASIVIHKCAKESSCEIFFETEFSIEKSEDFQKILHKYDIRLSDFNINGNYWSSKKTSIEKSDWKINIIQGFISEMANFPNAIKKIIWTHSDCPSYSPLNYATLFDMPGTGGKDSHESVINKVFEDETPEIICYVLDTDRGIPGKEAVEPIKVIAEKCLKNNTMLFWLYSKPTNGKEQEIVGEMKRDEYWLADKRQRLNEFVDSIYSVYPTTESAENESDQIAREMDADKIAAVSLLKNAPIIDARNSFTQPTDNTANAMNAFAIIIQQYFIKILEQYTDTLNTKLTEFQIPDVFDEFVETPNKENYPDKLKDIFDVIYHNKESLNLKNFDKVAEAIKAKLHISNNEPDFKNQKIKKYLNSLKYRINNLVNSVLDKYTTGIISKEIDLNKFYNYKADLNDASRPENLLFFDVQVYHWFKLFYSNKITDSYTHNFSNDLYHKLEALLNELKEYNSSVLYIWK
ncbi:MAG: dynamin family protein [Bacteroidales bacterium]|nr:dynamin family protein [Bacteroidales bacterium]